MITFNTSSILESISDGVFTVNLNWEITYFNRAAEEITGVKRQQALGKLCWEVFKSNMCETSCALKQTLKTNQPIVNKTAYIINTQGEKIPISLSTAVLKDEQGKIIGGAETFRDLREIEQLKQNLSKQFRLGEIVSRSPLMQQIFETIPTIAESDAPVLILGETGTGKELLAKTIHALSRRKKNPFVAINCAALPEQLLESELFGYKKGAFTGAYQDKPGRFYLANKGTLFLDEIGDMALNLQAKLLRVLQEKTIEPIGGTKSIRIDVRIIAATNKDLTQLMKEKKFREDLYYRLNVIKINLPPLRKRKEDIPLLADFFLAKFNQLYHKRILQISPEVLSIFTNYDWPGNVRELENVVERAVILAKNKEITLKDLPEELNLLHAPSTSNNPLKTNKQELEKKLLIQTLQKYANNKTKAAKALGIHKTTLYRKLKKYNLLP